MGWASLAPDMVFMCSGGLKDTLGLEAVPAHKHIDHSAIGETVVVTQGIELCVEGHWFATGTIGCFVSA